MSITARQFTLVINDQIFDDIILTSFDVYPGPDFSPTFHLVAQGPGPMTFQFSGALSEGSAAEFIRAIEDLMNPPNRLTRFIRWLKGLFTRGSRS